MEEANEKLNLGNAYICWYAETDGPLWAVYNQKGTPKQLVYLEGNEPIDHINGSSFFYFAKNTFLIQGKMNGKRLVWGEGNIQDYYDEDIEICNRLIQSIEGNYECHDIIVVEKWDIITPIDREVSFLASRNYLNIFDFIK